MGKPRDEYMTQAEICRREDMSQQRFSALSMERGAPRKTKAGKYNFRLWLMFLKQREVNKGINRGTPAVELTKRRIKKLDIEIDQIQGKLVPIERMHELIRGICTNLNRELDQFVSWVSADIRQARAVERAEAIRDRVKRAVIKSIEQHPDT